MAAVVPPLILNVKVEVKGFQKFKIRLAIRLVKIAAFLVDSSADGIVKTARVY